MGMKLGWADWTGKPGHQMTEALTLRLIPIKELRRSIRILTLFKF